MKKLILVGVTLIVAGISFTSCVKTCACKEVENDVTVSTSEEPMVVGIKCEDLSSYVTDLDGKKTGTICE